MVDLSAQVIINCEAGGSCSGGQPSSVYRFANTHGIPHMSCEQYEAHNIDSRAQLCSDFAVCRDCMGPPPPANETGFDTCWAIDEKDWTHYYASGYGRVSGADRMKAELFKNGPISCGIEATNRFDKYTGGIYEEKLFFPMINHEIAVVGWGVENGVEYWVGRNSWGTYWGERGFFRIKMHQNNLGIERDCTYAIPSYEKKTIYAQA